MRIYVLSALLLLASTAEARSTVLRKDGHDIYVDLGTDDGVVVGTRLALFHVITAEHPVTHKKVRDVFPMGGMEVVKAGRHMCIAHAAAEIEARVNPGDEIERATPAQTWIDPWKPAGSAEGGAAPPPTDAAGRRRVAEQAVKDAAVVEQVWKETTGKPPAERIILWKALLARDPDNVYAKAIRVEIGSLQAQVDIEDSLAAEAARAGGESTLIDTEGKLQALDRDVQFGGPLAYVPPARVYEGAPFELAYLVVKPGSVRSAWVHYRRAGDATYRRAELVGQADGELRQVIPADVVGPPAVEYFVEVLAEGAQDPQEVVGAAAAPVRVAVDASVEEPRPDRKHRSRITFFWDYVDFDGGFAEGFDEYTHAEADFMYRFRSPVYAMRLGFGTLRGQGGPKDIIDADPTGQCRDTAGTYRCRRVGFDYTYVELEFHLTDFIALMARPVVGSASRDETAPGTPGDGREFFNAVGLRSRARLGREDETNLVLGIGLTQHFGTLYEAAFTWDVVKAFPIVLTAQVTDQPVVEDYGVRLIADVGWRGLSWVYPSARISYQARDINHTGVSGGMAVNFDW